MCISVTFFLFIVAFCKMIHARYNRPQNFNYKMFRLVYVQLSKRFKYINLRRADIGRNSSTLPVYQFTTAPINISGVFGWSMHHRSRRLCSMSLRFRVIDYLQHIRGFVPRDLLMNFSSSQYCTNTANVYFKCITCRQ